MEMFHVFASIHTIELRMWLIAGFYRIFFVIFCSWHAYQLAPFAPITKCLTQDGCTLFTDCKLIAHAKLDNLITYFSNQVFPNGSHCSI